MTYLNKAQYNSINTLTGDLIDTRKQDTPELIHTTNNNKYYVLTKQYKANQDSMNVSLLVPAKSSFDHFFVKISENDSDEELVKSRTYKISKGNISTELPLFFRCMDKDVYLESIAKQDLTLMIPLTNVKEIMDAKWKGTIDEEAVLNQYISRDTGLVDRLFNK